MLIPAGLSKNSAPGRVDGTPTVHWQPLVVVAALVAGCGGKRDEVAPAKEAAGAADATAAAPAFTPVPGEASDPELPAGDAVLTGRLGGEGEPKVSLTLRFDPTQPSGTVSYDGVTTYTLRQPKLELIAKRHEANAVVARYRLSYRVDGCEGYQPSIDKRPGWDICAHADGKPAPVHELEAEVLIARKRAPGIDMVGAVGTDDVFTANNSFSLGGALKP